VLMSTFWFQATIVGVGFVGAALVSSGDDGTVLCPLRRCSGGYCPGCGMTRAAGELVRGNLSGAWNHHPVVFFLVAQYLAVVAIWSAGPAKAKEWVRRRNTPLLLANTIVLVAVWAIRLGTGSIPIPFFN